MPQLAELQQRFAGAVLGGAPAILPLQGTIRPEEAFAIHRDTVIGALVNALRLSYPTVDTLVGADFFDAMAHLFALAHPPRQADLNRFGPGFAGFVERFEPANGLRYLADVARLDWAVGQALRQPHTSRAFVLDPRVALILPSSLTVLRCVYPAHAIRAAIGDDAALAALDVSAADHPILVWRRDDMAAVQRVRPEAADFVRALLAGCDAETAVVNAGPYTQLSLAIIQQDVFTASFCKIQPYSEIHHDRDR